MEPQHSPTSTTDPHVELTSVPTDIPKLWRPVELAKQFGLSRQSIYRLMSTGALDVVQLAFTPKDPDRIRKRSCSVMRITDASVRRYLAGCFKRGRD